MSKLVKGMMEQSLSGRYAQLDSALWVELVGADGLTTNSMRRALRSKNMRIEVVRNALFRRACSSGPLSRLAESLEGPSALVTGGDSLIDVAKVIEEWLPKIAGLKLRGAVLEGEYLDERAVKGLSKMPTKRDVLAQVAGAARSPGAKLAAAINSGGGRIAGCIKALIEKLEKGESGGAEASAA